ncbi:NPCBM/NEW2 domain protein [Planctomycetes bacterium CA13]|uniref:NPCBM/NEW2 domain protein n=1 Tax=Novipirellula herctigrandis TaxID=2527986 RepID=A0A5C5YVY0_9BACT|nr:NPCBM/NEW2 domain protein [Planctomycetes bacterium CA13]
MLIQWILLALIAVTPVRVLDINGEKTEGQFAGVKDSQLLLNVAEDNPKSIPFSELSSLEPITPPNGQGPMMRVTLGSGTIIAAQTVALKNDKVTVEPRRQDTLSVPIEEVRSIRFNAAMPTVDPTWLAKIEEERRGDTLAIRREGDRLDFIEGLVTAISADTVTIEMDGDAIDAPISRLEGIIFGGKQTTASTTDIQIVDVYGSRWYATGIGTSPESGPLVLNLHRALTHRLPLEQIASIRWTGGISMLASLSPASKSHTEYVETKIPKSTLDAWFGPASDGGQDLILYGDSTIEYRIEDGFTTFASGVRRDESVHKATEAVVRVIVDEKKVWEETLRDGTVRGLQIPLSNGRRMRIEVDCGSDGDLGDTIRFLRPRFFR